ncbi:nucleoporin Nic96p [Monosporozyma servazzii]
MTLIKPVNGNDHDGNGTSEQQKSSTSKLFNDLLESSKSLPTASSDLGSIQLSIHEINRRARELRTHTTATTTRNGDTVKQDGQGDHTKAHYLLAGSGLQFDEVDTSLKLLERNQILSNATLGRDSTATGIHAGMSSNLPSATADSSHSGVVTSATTALSGSNAEFTEIDNYLKIKKDENILASIEMLLSNAARDFDNYINDNLKLDWDERKNVIKQNFGILANKKPNSSKASQPDKVLNNDNLMKFWNKNTTGSRLDGLDLLNDNNNNDDFSRLNVNEHYMLREKFEKNAKIIHGFNNARQQKTHFPLNREFIALLNNNSNDSKSRQLLESWQILESLQQVKGATANATTNNNICHNNLIITNAKKYLENEFKEYVDVLYNKQMDEGLPTNINKIKSFIEKKLKNNSSSNTSNFNTNPDASSTNTTTSNINDIWKINNLTIINGTPIWALIFYLLRAGMEKEALEVMVNNKSNFKKIEQSFVTYFKAYIHSKSNGNSELPTEFMTRLHNEYSQHIKNSLNGDPYRLAVYKIIGRCDLTRKSIPSITLNVEDWLWIHFMLIKEETTTGILSSTIINDSIYEKYTLAEFQQLIISYGVQRFNNYYLQILMLSGLFELAVEYAYKINEIDAVHLAIGICNQHLLNISTNPLTGSLLVHGEDPTSTNINSKFSINFVKVITTYIKSFKFSDPRIALEYLLLIGLNAEVGKDNLKSLMHECIRELVLQTKEFTILLGKISRDGSRIPGVIEQRKPLLLISNDVDNKEYLKVITEQAALRADEDGRVYDSLLLYQLSEEYNIVISIINNIISDLLSDSDLNGNILVNINDNSETNPILLAEKLIDIHLNSHNSSNSAISNKQKETCLLLLQIVEVRKLFDSSNTHNLALNDSDKNNVHFGQWEEILNKIAGLDILPLIVTNSNDTDASTSSSTFKGNEESCIRKKAEEFNLLDSNIVKCIPNLLIITMISLNKTIQKLQTSINQTASQSNSVTTRSNDDSRLDQIQIMKRIAKNCMIYAGMIQYKMPRETYSTLIQIDVAL